MNLKPIWIYFENGVLLKAKSFGKNMTAVGEVVFNTSLSGYEEILTDPSYAGQFIIFTMPEIGIVGINKDDMESNKIHAKAVIVRNISKIHSNFRAEDSLGSFLDKFGTLGITDIDTRYLTKMIRDEGVMMAVASTEISDKEKLREILEDSPKMSEINFIEQVSTKKKFKHNTAAWDYTSLAYKKAKNSEKKIAVLDFGVKQSILNELCENGFEVEVYPQSTSAEELINDYQSSKIQGIMLSNGPGDPRFLKEIVEKTKKLIKARIPLLGICLGHQILSIAKGHNVYKMPFGQHGANHPVKCNGHIEITSQNHNYNVPESISEIANITHINLFDNSIEGVEYKDELICSVQHHPEAGPGPNEAKSVFKSFVKMFDRGNKSIM